VSGCVCVCVCLCLCVSGLHATLLSHDRGANAAGLLEEEALPELPTSDNIWAHILKSTLSMVYQSCVYGVSIVCLWCINRHWLHSALKSTVHI
jgi:hypothetical protein